jgi:hypothetical protein
MPCYIISHEVMKDREYEPFRQAIKAYGTWARITYSTWAVVTDESAKQVRDNLLKHLGSDDRLFVVKSGVESAWHNVRCKNEWLKKNL